MYCVPLVAESIAVVWILIAFLGEFHCSSRSVLLEHPTDTTTPSTISHFHQLLVIFVTFRPLDLTKLVCSWIRTAKSAVISASVEYVAIENYFSRETAVHRIEEWKPVATHILCLSY